MILIENFVDNAGFHLLLILLVCRFPRLSEKTLPKWAPYQVKF